MHPEDFLFHRGPIWHGTAIGWNQSLLSDAVKLPLVSPRFSGITVVNKKMHLIAYSVYLPTMGNDDDFIEVLDTLEEDLVNNMSVESSIVIGLDANTSSKSTTRRQNAFNAFLT